MAHLLLWTVALGWASSQRELVSIGYFAGGDGAECFNVTTTPHTHLVPCPALSRGDLRLEWTARPPAVVAGGEEFVANWSVTATRAFIATHGAKIGHSNLHACQGVGSPEFGLAQCNPYTSDSQRYITTRNPAMSGTLNAGVPTNFSQRFIGGLTGFSSASGLSSVVMAHVIIDDMSVALPSFVASSACAAGTRRNPGGNSTAACSASQDCCVCEAGRFSAASGADACDACAPGKFQDQAGQPECKACGCGVFSFAGATTCVAAGTVCRPGTFGNVSSATCDPCPPSQFCVNGRARPFGEATLCPPGTRVERKPAASSDRTCVACEPGQFSSDSNAAVCTGCPVGKFQAWPGQAFCETCEEGWVCDQVDTSSATAGLVSPRLCPAGFSCNSTHSLPCDPTTVSVQETGQCRTCPSGKFALLETNACVQCPDEACIDCITGTQPAVETDTYCVDCAATPVLLSDAGLSRGAFVRCPQSGVCRTQMTRYQAPGKQHAEFAVTTTCADRYTGVLCGSCEAGMVRNFLGRCVTCPSDGFLYSSFILGCMAFGVLYILSVRTALKFAMKPESKSGYVTLSVLKILYLFLYNSSLLEAYQLDWGSTVSYVFGIGSAASGGDISAAAMPACLGYTFHNKILSICCAPLIILLLPLLPLCWQKFVRGKQSVLSCPFQEAYIASVLIGWWMLHPTVLQECAMVFNTIRVADRSYVASALEVATDDPAYVLTRKLAIVMFSTFIPLVPLVIFGNLFFHRQELSHDAMHVGVVLRQRFYFFFGTFKPKYYYWEAVWGACKTVLVILASVAASSPEPQGYIFIAIWVVQLAFVLEIHCSPFINPLENSLIKAATFALLTLVLIGQGLSTANRRPQFSAALRAMAAIVTVGMVIVFSSIFLKQSYDAGHIRKCMRNARCWEKVSVSANTRSARTAVPFDEFDRRESVLPSSSNPLRTGTQQQPKQQPKLSTKPASSAEALAKERKAGPKRPLHHQVSLRRNDLEGAHI